MWNQPPAKAWSVAAGPDYSLYRTDLYTASERYDNRGFFVRGTHRIGERWRFDLSFRLDDDDFDTYATVQAALRFEW